MKSNMKKRINDHIQNQKKNPTKLQKLLDAFKEQAAQVEVSQDSHSNVEKTEVVINSATSKKDKKNKVDLKPINNTLPLSQIEQGGNKPEA